jgi:hypothetical protein
MVQTWRISSSFCFVIAVDLLDVLVRQRLDRLLGATPVVRGDRALRLEVLEHRERLTAPLAHTDLVLLGQPCDVLDQLLAALLGQRRDRAADHLAVVARREAEVRGLDRLLDRPMAPLSYGETTIERGSGALMLASWLSGVGVP